MTTEAHETIEKFSDPQYFDTANGQAIVDETACYQQKDFDE